MPLDDSEVSRSEVKALAKVVAEGGEVILHVIPATGGRVWGFAQGQRDGGCEATGLCGDPGFGSSELAELGAN